MSLSHKVQGQGAKIHQHGVRLAGDYARQPGFKTSILMDDQFLSTHITLALVGRAPQTDSTLKHVSDSLQTKAPESKAKARQRCNVQFGLIYDMIIRYIPPPPPPPPPPPTMRCAHRPRYQLPVTALIRLLIIRIPLLEHANCAYYYLCCGGYLSSTLRSTYSYTACLEMKIHLFLFGLHLQRAGPY